MKATALIVSAAASVRVHVLGTSLCALLCAAASDMAHAQGGAAPAADAAFPAVNARASVQPFMLQERDSAAVSEEDSTEDDTTQYESTRSTPAEQAALIGANAILIPLALAVGAVSIAPPSFGMVVDDGVAYASVSFETGIGVGPKLETGRFADKRLMLSYTHVYNVHRHDLWRIEGVKDFNFGYLDRRNIVAFGVSPMIGLYTDGPARGFSLGTSARLMLPSLPYFGFFPLHTFGVTYRYNRNFSGKDFHTAALGISAAVIF